MKDVLYFNTWYRGHNNARYSELLPRLERVDARLLTFPKPRLVRAATERLWRATRPRVEPVVLRRLERSYPYAFVTDVRQLPMLDVPTVVDVDDPEFERDAALLRRGRVAAYVVTEQSVGRRFEALGVGAPWHVVPQGAPLDRLDPRLAAEIAADKGGAPVAGFVSAFLLLPGDRGGGNPLYDVTHLLELWDEIVRRVPDAQLWLVGRPSARVRRRLGGRGDVRLLGQLPRDRSFAYTVNFDVALYPRRPDDGIRRVKTAEYLGAGVPLVAYDYPSVSDVKEAGGGVFLTSPEDFVDAVERLLADGGARAGLAAAARAAGAARDWRVLAERYAAILDEHLPRLD